MFGIGRDLKRSSSPIPLLEQEHLPWYIDYANAFFPVLLAILILRSFIAEPFRIPTGSMIPTLLVGDLILLAKSVQSDFVTPVDTDVAELTELVFDKSLALGERRWQLESVAFTRAMIDPTRITQAWLQLAANAVRYSDPGSTVALGSAATGSELRLWVRDEGTGIAPQDLERIRQRFVRTAQARARSSGSASGPIA